MTVETAMGQLCNTIRLLVIDEKYVVGHPAAEMLEERGIMEWQVAAGMPERELIVERPDATPNPAVEVRLELPDGTEFKAVWSYLTGTSHANPRRAHQTNAVCTD